jgi:Tol biopolymer transport system component
MNTRTWSAGGIFLAVLALGVFSATAQLVALIGSAFTPPAGGDGDSSLPIISADGRFVLFASTADNLVPATGGSVLPRRMNVFLRDRALGTTTLLSASLAGVGGNGNSFPTAISTNGQFALFESAAGDLAANDSNGVNDVFVRDVINGTTTLVSVNTNGIGGNGLSRNSVMTPDGRYVAFVSSASDLVAGDTNGIPDIFVRDLQLGKTMLVSAGATSTDASSPFSGSSESPEITPDGRYVVFYSTATNLVPGVTTTGEIYVTDLTGGTTAWASAPARTLFQLLLGTANVISYNASISANGRYAAFEVSSNGSVGASAQGIILRYDLVSRLTDVVDTNANVPYLPFNLIHTLAMTPDGQFIAFVGNENGSSGTTTAIYLWDGGSDIATLVSGDLEGNVPANTLCDLPAISDDAQSVAFISNATNLTANTLTGDFHVYVSDRQAGVTRLLDMDTNGLGMGVNPTMVPALSADGHAVAFDAANLLNDNRRQNDDVFASGVSANSTELISVHDPVLATVSPNGLSGYTSFSVSTNSRLVAFFSDADNLAPFDTNGCRDVFVRDRLLGTNLLVSVDSNGVFSADGISTEPSISGDGRYVVFTSSADNLVPGDTNDAQDVFVRDLQTASTMLVSVSLDGFHPGNGDSYSPVISQDGRYILFHSKASNLTVGSFGTGAENLFVRDLQAGTNYALTFATSGTTTVPAAMTPDGSLVAFIGVANGVFETKMYVWSSQSNKLIFASSAPLNYPPYQISISPNGQKLAYLPSGPGNIAVNIVDLVAHTTALVGTIGFFSYHSGLQFSSNGFFLTYAESTNTALSPNIYLHNFVAGTDFLVSQNFNSTGAANGGILGGSDSPVISPDGRFIAYRSTATNLVTQDFNKAADVCLYDVSNNATILVSANASGTVSADSVSLQPVFSADGQTLFFQSWAADLIANDFNHGSDLFALDLAGLPLTLSGGGGSTNSSTFLAKLFRAGSLAPTPTVAWPLAAGQTYRVQFKNNLADSEWQNLPGNLTFVGDTGYLNDPSPSASQRFYRVIMNP